MTNDEIYAELNAPDSAISIHDAAGAVIDKIKAAQAEHPAVAAQRAHEAAPGGTITRRAVDLFERPYLAVEGYSVPGCSPEAIAAFDEAERARKALIDACDAATRVAVGVSAPEPEPEETAEDNLWDSAFTVPGTQDLAQAILDIAEYDQAQGLKPATAVVTQAAQAASNKAYAEYLEACLAQGRTLSPSELAHVATHGSYRIRDGEQRGQPDLRQARPRPPTMTHVSADEIAGMRYQWHMLTDAGRADVYARASRGDQRAKLTLQICAERTGTSAGDVNPLVVERQRQERVAAGIKAAREREDMALVQSTLAKQQKMLAEMAQRPSVLGQLWQGPYANPYTAEVRGSDALAAALERYRQGRK
jgi:hypothetical protein